MISQRKPENSTQGTPVIVREYKGVIETNILDGNTTPKRGLSNTSACAVRKINNKII